MNHHRADKHELNTGDRSAAGLPFRFLLDAFWVQWRILLIPWQALVFWVSCCTNVMVRFLTAAGAPPITYKDKLKLKETQKFVEHMHQREDGFRRKIKDLQLKIDVKGREVKRLEIKLAKAQNEFTTSPMRRADSAQLDNGNTKTIQDYWLAKHFYFWIIGVFPMFWLLQQPNAPSISKKFAWCIISPVALLYTHSILGAGPRATPTIIQCSTLFLTGFVFCHWLHAHC